MVSVSKSAKKRMLAVNDRGYVIGEQHHRAKLTDHEVDLVLQLLDEGVSERVVAAKFEVSRRTIRDYKRGSLRSQIASGWKKRAVKSGGGL